MADVFVSYKREDVARVRKLVAALRASGLDVWWDEDIPPSAPWEATIEKALADARTVVVCWSPASVASENVRSEARVAREDGRLVQVFVQACKPPLFFGERQGFDLSKWRGNARDPRLAALVNSLRASCAGEPAESPARSKGRRIHDLRMAIAAAFLILLAGSFAGWWLLSPAKAQGPQTLAVLPFRALNPADANLVDAIWDDTRGAIGRNPNLRVLGRQAMEALAKKDLQPADYRKKVGADYLLDGSVEHVGDRIEMKLDLVRTSDGAEVWSDRIGGKLDDVFAFQQRVASEVEGRIRGRVAPGGGVTSKNIATTGEVYALYAEARAKIRKRDFEDVREGGTLLRKALAIDPNYAPAWAELGVATFWGRQNKTADEGAAEAEPIIRHALELAPNLARAHATLALVRMLSPETEGEIRKAVALDPSDGEAWMWLGNVFLGQNRMKPALEAYSRAVEVEPLFPQAVGNKINALMLLNDRAAVAAELDRIKRTGDEMLFERSQWVIAADDGRPGDAVRIFLTLRPAHPEIAGNIDLLIRAPLMQLGFIEEALRAGAGPSDTAQDYRGIPAPPEVFRAAYKRPIEFWQDNEAPALYGRLLPKFGRLQEYVGYYRAAFKSPEDFFDSFARQPQRLMTIGPTAAVVLREGGEAAASESILRRVDSMIGDWLHNGPAHPEILWKLAYVRAAEGHDDEAIPLLRRAVAGGALPDRKFYAVDIVDEPCFARLVNRPDFQAVRQRILARIAEERRKVPLSLLAEAYPVKPAKAA